MKNPFRYFNSSPEVIGLTVMMYIRYLLLLRQVEDLPGQSNGVLAMIRFAMAVCTLAFPLSAAAQQHSPYAGFETREIKSLSEADIADLRCGAGWGLALAAELNGVPGPAHLLELREEIGLDAKQVAAIQEVFAGMQAEARSAGGCFIAAEEAIEAAFRAGGLETGRLRALIYSAAEARAELRLIHLSRHLAMPLLLTPDQIARYNELRGHETADPCANVPDGHDPGVWRRHNGCD